MKTAKPRVVIVTRATEYQTLIARHATRGQAEFFLSSRGRSIDELEMRHQNVEQALQQLMRVLPIDWLVDCGVGNLESILATVEADMTVAPYLPGQSRVAKSHSGMCIARIEFNREFCFIQRGVEIFTPNISGTDLKMSI